MFAYIWDALGTAIIGIIIFGGGMFVLTAIRYWVATLIQNHRRRIHARRIADTAVSAWVNHL